MSMSLLPVAQHAMGSHTAGSFVACLRDWGLHTSGCSMLTMPVHEISQRVHHACAGLSCRSSHRCKRTYRSCHCKLLVDVQAFHALYHTDENVLLGAPTGSGKTISAELAMLRVFNHYPGQKIIYIAPLKVPCCLALFWH